MNCQCAGLYLGLWSNPQCNVLAPATPLGFEPVLIAHSRVMSQGSNQSGQRIRSTSERLAGQLGVLPGCIAAPEVAQCHVSTQQAAIYKTEFLLRREYGFESSSSQVSRQPIVSVCVDAGHPRVTFCSGLDHLRCNWRICQSVPSSELSVAEQVSQHVV